MPQIKDRAIQEIEDSENTAYLLESRVWDNLTSKMFRDILSQWRNALLTNQNIDDGTRKGYIIARQAVLNAFQSQYKKFGVELPKWLED